MKYIPASEVEGRRDLLLRKPVPDFAMVMEFDALLASAVELPEPGPKIEHIIDEAGRVVHAIRHTVPDDKLREAAEEMEWAIPYLETHLRHMRSRNDPMALAFTNGLAEYKAKATALRKEGT